MPLIVKKKLHETWREIVARRGGTAALDAYEARIADGASEVEAAYRSLAAAGLLWRADEPGSEFREAEAPVGPENGPDP